MFWPVFCSGPRSEPASSWRGRSGDDSIKPRPRPLTTAVKLKRNCSTSPDLDPRVHASSLCIPKTSPQSALRSRPSLAQSGGSDSPDVSVTTPSIGPQPLMREPWDAYQVDQGQ